WLDAFQNSSEAVIARIFDLRRFLNIALVPVHPLPPCTLRSKSGSTDPGNLRPATLRFGARSGVGANRSKIRCKVPSLWPSEARKHKTFLSSNSHDRVRRSLLRGIRFLASIQETCRYWLLRNQLRIRVEHLARRQTGPNQDELRR